MGRRKHWKQVTAGVALSGMTIMQLLSPCAVWAESTADAVNASQQTVEIQSTQAKTSQLQLVSETPVTAGAVLRKYIKTFQRGEETVQVTSNVVVVDLYNPNVKLDVMTGSNEQLTQRETVLNMAKQTGAVAGVNGDYYNVQGEGSPLGPSISEGTMITSPSQLTGLYAFGVTNDRKPVIDMYTFEGTVTAVDGESYALSGINKTYYYTEPDHEHSHQHKIYLYTSAWGQKDRGNDGSTTPTEVLVVDGIIEQISLGEKLDMVVPENGYILRAAGNARAFVEENLRVGDPIDIEYEMKSIHPDNTYTDQDFQMMIGGHTILVENGQAATYSRDISSIDGYRSRTGVGYSEDGRYVYLITADHAEDSAGLSIKEFQELMLDIGVWKGMNLDGGGSTQLVSRPLGSFEPKLVNTTEFGGERQIVNGLGVYSTAPDGELKGILIDGSQILFMNEQTDYQYRAYDEYFNPIDTMDTAVNWSDNGGLGIFEDNTYTAIKSGTTQITATSGNATESKEIRVLSRNDLASLEFVSGMSSVLTPGQTYAVRLEAVTKDGIKKTVPYESVEWEFIGFDGSVQEEGIVVDQVGDLGYGQIIARYDDFSTMMTMTAGVEQTLVDFDEQLPLITKEVYPAEVDGSLSASEPFHDSNGNALILHYDFTEGSGSKALYASFQDDEGIQIPGQPLQMKMDVYGDHSYNWIAAELLDADGALHRAYLSKNMNWSGWKTVSLDLASLNLKQPLKLKRVYVVNPEDGQDERALEGTIAFDEITFQYASEMEQLTNPKVFLKLNEPQLRVDETLVELDQSPVLKDNYTLIPIRFIVDALGGDVRWDQDTKKITVIKGDDLLEMWLGSTEMVKNGQWITSPMAPAVLQERTMVPLRFIAETLGWEVGWDQETKEITLQ